VCRDVIRDELYWERYEAAKLAARDAQRKVAKQREEAAAAAAAAAAGGEGEWQVRLCVIWGRDSLVAVFITTKFCCDHHNQMLLLMRLQHRVVACCLGLKSASPVVPPHSPACCFPGY
jgi:hypothetical protein